MNTRCILFVCTAALGAAGALAQTVQIPPEFALPRSVADESAPGFKVRVVQADAAQVGFVRLEASSARAEAQLAGALLDPATGQPYADVADKSAFNADGTYDETGVIDYEQNGGATTFVPGIPGTTLSLDDFALEAVTYLDLAAGNYTMVVNSDDGFRLSVGRDARDWFNRITVGEFEGGRGAADSVFSFSITQAGLYSFRLLWYEAGGGANVAWFSADPADPANRTLINDTFSGGIRAFRAITKPRPTYIRYVSPAPGANGVSPTTTIEVQIGDGDAVQVDPASLELYLNDTKVDATVEKTGVITKLVFDPPGLLPPLSDNRVRLVYRDTAAAPNTRTEEFSFAVRAYVSITLPEPLYFEDFDDTPEGSLPAGWTQISYTDQSASSPDEDFENLDSAAYARWTVVNVDRFRGAFVTYSNPDNPDAWENDYKRVLSFNPANVVNGEVVRELATGRFVFGNSGYRNGRSQVLFLFTPDFDLRGKTDVFLSFHSLWEQNQDSFAAAEYSIDGGQTWLPIVYLIDEPDVIRDGAGQVDAVATFTQEYGDVARYTDPDTGEDKGGFYGAFIGAPVSQDLAPFISPRVNDNAVESKRVELFRLTQADNQATVRFRFAHAGTDSWYWGIDNFGLYSIPPSVPPNILAQPRSATVVEGNPVTFSVLAEGSAPLTYQWFHDGRPIDGATGDAFTIEAVRMADAGRYSVRISNLAGERLSDPATLDVTPRPPAVFGLWNFDGDLSLAAGVGTLEYADGDLTASLTTFETTDGAAVPHIDGQPAQFMRVPAFAELGNGYNLTMPMPPNGGGSYVNQYTLILDVLVPFDVNWLPFFNTNPANSAGNDADFYLSDTGGLGIGALGYSPAGTIAPDTWYRIAFVANLASGRVTYYVNGQAVHTRTGAPLLDGRFSLNSENQPGPDLRLFNEGDTSGQYTHEVLVNSLFFIDRAMAAGELQALGGPSAAGIPAPAPPTAVLRAALVGSQLALTWTAAPNVVLQKTASLSAPDWQDVPGTLGAGSATEPLSGSAGFYRLFRR